MLYGMACAPECLGLARSAERDAVLVRCHPLVERLQLGIQRTRELNAAVASVEVVKVGLKLEHVPDVVGAGEVKASEDLGRHAVVAPPVLFLTGIARDRPERELAARIIEDRAREPACLRAGGAGHGDDLLVGHACSDGW